MRNIQRKRSKSEVKNSIGYLSGVKERGSTEFKTNPGTYNVEGVLISINPSKIDENGWRVSVGEFKTYDCTYTSSARIMPEYVIKRDEYIPTYEVKAEVSIDTINQKYNILKIFIGAKKAVLLKPGTTTINHETSSLVLDNKTINLNADNVLVNGEDISKIAEPIIPRFKVDDEGNLYYYVGE